MTRIYRRGLFGDMLPAHEEADAAEFISATEWIPVVEPISVLAGELGRRWRGSHSGIGIADLIIAATADLTDSSLLTLNVRHFPMVNGLRSAYWAPPLGTMTPARLFHAV
jgi:predicted nucleic acid-binding protein